MYGIEPDVDLKTIKDDMANIEAGFSSVKHPANELDRSYPDLVIRASTHGCDRLFKGTRPRSSSTRKWLQCWSKCCSEAYIQHAARPQGPKSYFTCCVKMDPPAPGASTSGTAP